MDRLVARLRCPRLGQFRASCRGRNWPLRSIAAVPLPGGVRPRASWREPVPQSEENLFS
jgi:hypothetical protein